MFGEDLGEGEARFKILAEKEEGLVFGVLRCWSSGEEGGVASCDWQPPSSPVRVDRRGW